MSQSLYFHLSVLVLTAMLFVPVSRLVWAMSVRRLERRTGAELDETARTGQLNRARFIALVLCLAFSYLFNLSLLGPPHG